MTEKKLLYELGLSEAETDVYLRLLESGASQAGVISKKTHLNRTTTYQILEKLINKGLVGFIQKGVVKVFQAVSPERLVSLQQEKLDKAKELVPKLQVMAAPVKERVMVFQGRQGIRTIMNEILGCKRYISFGSGGQFLEVMKHDFFFFQKEKRKLHIKSRAILGFSSRNMPIVQEAHAQFRFVPDTSMNPSTTWVYQDKVAIIVWSANPIATVIENTNVAKAYKAYFELLWKNANK